MFHLVSGCRFQEILDNFKDFCPSGDGDGSSAEGQRDESLLEDGGAGDGENMPARGVRKLVFQAHSLARRACIGCLALEQEEQLVFAENQFVI